MKFNGDLAKKAAAEKTLLHFPNCNTSHFLRGKSVYKITSSVFVQPCHGYIFCSGTGYLCSLVVRACLLCSCARLCAQQR